MIHVTCRLTAKNRDQLRNPIRSVIEYELAYLYLLAEFKGEETERSEGNGHEAGWRNNGRRGGYGGGKEGDWYPPHARSAPTFQSWLSYGNESFAA